MTAWWQIDIQGSERWKMLRKDANLISGRDVAQAKKTKAPSRTRRPADPASRTSGRVLVLELDGKEIEVIAFPEELRDLPLQWFGLPGGKAVARESYRGQVVLASREARSVRHSTSPCSMKGRRQ